jgi:hypothetical protein
LATGADEEKVGDMEGEMGYLIRCAELLNNEIIDWI